jgi:hypothetical protein
MTFRPRSILAGLALTGVLAISGSAVVLAVGPNAPDGTSAPSGKGPCATQAQAARANPTVETLRAFGDCEIARRITTLDKLTSVVSGSKVLTSSDAVALAAKLTSAKAGLTSLKATVDSATSVEALKADVKKIATDYRVYVLLVPQVHLVSGADGVIASQTRFSDMNTRLAARIATAKAAGKDTSVAQGHLDAMNAAAAQAATLARPIPGRVLPLTPAGWNAGTAGPVLTQARTDLVSAREKMRTAMSEARACREALRDIR